MGMPTLLDVIRLKGGDAAVGLIDEASRAHPEVRLGAARTIKGLNYKTNVRTALPSIGFRRANEGTAIAGSTFEQRLVECYLLNPPFEVDKAVADVYEDGWRAYLALEASGIMEGAMNTLGKCFFYGTDATHGDAKGFPGLLQSYDNTNMVVDATGTTATTGSSVWMVRFGPQHVQWVLGQGGQVSMGDVSEVVIRPTTTTMYTAYHQELYMRPGLQVGSIYSICRIKKLTADSGKGLTDDLIAEALSKFPTGTRPDVMFMSRRSLFQLQSSRTATNPTGAPAPIPSEAFGVPIGVTDSISNVEALTL